MYDLERCHYAISDVYGSCWVGALFIALLGYLVSFLSKHQRKIRNEISRDSFGAALGEARIVARDAALYALQTLVDALKEASR